MTKEVYLHDVFCNTGKYYGPLHFSRHDLISMTIMRGRDYGLPDYNTVREQVGMTRVASFNEINPWLNSTSPEVTHARML